MGRRSDGDAESRRKGLLRRAVYLRRLGICERCGFYRMMLGMPHHLHTDTWGHEEPEDLAARCYVCHDYSHANGDDPDVDPREIVGRMGAIALRAEYARRVRPFLRGEYGVPREIVLELYGRLLEAVERDEAVNGLGCRRPVAEHAQQLLDEYHAERIKREADGIERVGQAIAGMADVLSGSRRPGGGDGPRIPAFVEVEQCSLFADMPSTWRRYKRRAR